MAPPIRRPRLWQVVQVSTGMPVHVAEDPLASVAMGAGKCVEEFEALQQVLVTEPRRY